MFRIFTNQLLLCDATIPVVAVLPRWNMRASGIKACTGLSIPRIACFFARTARSAGYPKK
jgi:hypothetical protein